MQPLASLSGSTRGAVVSWGTTVVDSCPGLRRRGRVPAVELRLPELPRSARRYAARDCPLAGVRGRRHRRRVVLHRVELLPRDPCPDRELPWPASAWAASFADRRHSPHERRPASLPGTPFTARVTPARRLRHRAGPPRAPARQRALPHAGALPRADDVEAAPARARRTD